MAAVIGGVTMTTRLEYQPPPALRDAVIEEGPGWVRINMGPTPNAIFIAMLLPWAIFLAGASVAFILLVTEWRATAGPRAWVLVPIALLVSGVYLCILSRHRHVPRVIEVVGGSLRYCDATTSGHLVEIPPDRRKRIRVSRPWWRPWPVRLIAEARPAFFSLRSNNEPIILLLGTRRSELEDVASAVRRALGMNDPV